MKYILLVVLFLSACTGTQIKAVKSSEAPQEPYKSIVVFVPGTDFATQQYAEHKTIDALERRGNGEYIAYSDIFTPLDSRPVNEMWQELKRRKIGAVLYSQFVDANSHSSDILIPVTSTSTSSTNGSVSAGTETAYFNARTTQATTNYQPMAITTSVWQYEIRLCDVNKHKNVWYAATTTESISDAKSMINSLIYKTVSEISKSGLIDTSKASTSGEKVVSKY